jgi:hypothetical protein
MVIKLIRYVFYFTAWGFLRLLSDISAWIAETSKALAVEAGRKIGI